MDLDIFDVANLFQNVKQCIQFLRGRNLLLADFFCCNQIASKMMDVSLSDKEIFQCKTCGKRTSIRKGSFWTKSKLPLTVLLALLYFFCQDLSVCETEKLMKKMCEKESNHPMV